MNDEPRTKNQEPRTLSPTSEDEGQRIDIWLSSRLTDLSRSRIQSLIADGHITMSDGSRLKSHNKVTKDTIVTVTIPSAEPVNLIPEFIPLDIIHEDADIIVINKQPGLVVHPAAGHPSGTLVNALLFHCKDLAGIGGEIRPGIVHRLDKDTSGVMVAAKRDSAMISLVDQFKERVVRKEYLAIVKGTPKNTADRIETEIGRSMHDRKKMSISTAAGRHAITNYVVETAFNKVSLVRLNIETGRTHQIRVHMAHIGHPVVGDAQYGRVTAGLNLPLPIKRQLLHAASLSFIHPTTKKNVTFKVPLPSDMADLLDLLDS